MDNDYDYCIIGGGIVGLATALALTERVKGARLVLLEKEADLAAHQTGHNSGVIHAGVYYQPGSLKARLCREGAQATKEFCTAKGIAFDVCGKLLVATNQTELDRMAGLAERAAANEIGFEHLNSDQLRRIEPAVSGLGALLVPSTGIVDYRQVCNAIAEEIASRGCVIQRSAAVTTVREDETGVSVATRHGRLRASKLIACAGLQSDRIARAAGLDIKHRIVPFRGEYYVLPPGRSEIVKHLIYPIPDPELPFLGVHLTRMIDGSITVGPNAVLGLSREGYAKGDLNFIDILDMVLFPGFWRTIAANLRSGLDELRGSLNKRHYLDLCRKYCPDLKLEDLKTPAAGIRAQAVLSDGTLVHDFLFVESERMLHVCNAPSPAATSAIPIGKMIVDRMLQ
ncbi:L-2-hydroxyglutarate oxidase [Rhizobium mongolense]|uniref:L-2-hydroxyglutarate oxidase n=1 Tax=Rhizobium mongolense TaxID=57676 RepID=UPI003558D8F4